MIFCGIDYGSKLAGTTAIASLNADNQLITIKLSEKKQDADIFIKQEIEILKPEFVFLDAPLSLPLVYLQSIDNQSSSDYFYRKADKLLQAMSPMFLGGLTARAMKLKAELSPLPFYETYPAQQAKRLHLNNLIYKKEKDEIKSIENQIMMQFIDYQLISHCKTWHEIDALLALLGAYRFWQGAIEVYGDTNEGLIYI